MPGITDRSTKEPLLKMKRINHGTLGCSDLARTRRFYEEVLGLQCVQTSPISMMISLNADFVYAVVETPTHSGTMAMLNHNGLEVETEEEVDTAYAALQEIKDEWGLRMMPKRKTHGDYGFYFNDHDGNMWEIVCHGRHGYIGSFHDPDYDITGRHQFDDWTRIFIEEKKLMHTHEPEVRALVKASGAAK